MDLVRALLLETEGIAPGDSLRSPAIEGYDQQTVFAHLELLQEAGLIHCTVCHSQQGRYLKAIIHDLTWQGHEFLGAARNETVWQRAMAKMADYGGSLPLAVFQTILIELAKKQLGL